ncbi:MAG: sigma-70 family RNA polymerase sigma factor [Acidobacteria bacterium]|nr:sigma-70 family RNA polymerase sigma factor [Acidobacteriota bacterium]
MPTRADLALVAALQAGSETAYEQLIDQYQQPVYNLVYRLLSDPGDACDVVQEVFLKIFRNIGNFRSQSSLKTWVYRIALNEANNRRRWFSRHKKHEVDLDRDDDHARSLQETIQDGGFSPFDLMLGTETQEKIEEALQKLSPSFRDAVVLRDIEELSYDEIAEILNINMGTVKSRILRGREALRKQLRQEGDVTTTTLATGTAATGSRRDQLCPSVGPAAGTGSSGD